MFAPLSSTLNSMNLNLWGTGLSMEDEQDSPGNMPHHGSWRIALNGTAWHGQSRAIEDLVPWSAAARERPPISWERHKRHSSAGGWCSFPTFTRPVVDDSRALLSHRCHWFVWVTWSNAHIVYKYNFSIFEVFCCTFIFRIKNWKRWENVTSLQYKRLVKYETFWWKMDQ